MSTELDDNWVTKTIVPKSDQLNADDLLTGPIQVMVTEVVQTGSADQPVAIKLNGGYKPWKPCKTMRRVLILIWGEVAKEWIGREIVLVNDPTVKWAGTEVGGIRILAMSHIKQAVKTMMTTTRGKRTPITIQPIVDNPVEQVKEPVPQTFLDKWRAQFAGSSPEVISLGKKIASAYSANSMEKLALAVAGLDVLSTADVEGVKLLRIFAGEVEAVLKSVVK